MAASGAWAAGDDLPNNQPPLKLDLNLNLDAIEGEQKGAQGQSFSGDPNYEKGSFANLTEGAGEYEIAPIIPQPAPRRLCQRNRFRHLLRHRMEEAVLRFTQLALPRTGPLPLPATHGSILELGGREGERAGTAQT